MAVKRMATLLFLGIADHAPAGHAGLSGGHRRRAEATAGSPLRGGGSWCEPGLGTRPAEVHHLPGGPHLRLAARLRKNVLNDNRLQQSLIFRFWPHWSLSIEKEISK